MYIPDLQLNISPYTALYTELVPDSALTVNEDRSGGRTAIILDFNNSDGLLARDLGTVFEWATVADTVLEVWQPSIIPLDDDVYQRMSFHFLMKSLGLTGWGHLREINLAYLSNAPLNILLTFDQWPDISLTVPSSDGAEIKQKIIVPPNKFKLVECFVTSSSQATGPLPWKLWSSDVQFKIGEWGRTGAYRVLKPLSD